MQIKAKIKIKKLTVSAMIIALAVLLVTVARVPVVMFLKYEPKDVIITIGGFIYGPLTAAVISLCTAFIEMITISSEGFIGFIMNFLSSAAFAVPAAYIYSKKRTISGAVIGLLTGVVSVCAVMMLWNYLITPLYMNVARADVAAMLPTVFFPFNLLKGTLNAAFSIIIYKPVVKTLRAAHLLDASKSEGKGRTASIIVTVCAILVVSACIVTMVFWRR